MSQAWREMDQTTDQWAIATADVPRLRRRIGRRDSLLVDLPCPPPAVKAPAATDFECEVIETAELARVLSISPHDIRARARRYAWGVGVSALLAIGTVSVPAAIWLGTVPAAFAAGFGWQWAVLRAAAIRLERESGHA
jgi:hypothetical protein